MPGKIHDPQEIVEKWCREKSGTPENLFVRTLRGKRMTFPMIAEVVKAEMAICSVCWDNWKGDCQCPTNNNSPKE